MTEGGITATHLPLAPRPVQAAPAVASQGKQHNTVRQSLVPFACWRANDMRFVFDSSVVLPEIKDDLQALKALIDLYTVNGGSARPALSVFGHADPTGSDDYNKSLSGRRAAAIYALLTRRDDIWEDLFTDTGKFAQPVAGDKWGMTSLQIMLGACGFSCGRIDGIRDDSTTDAIKQFQDANNLSLDGDPGPVTRRTLFLAYMNRICVQAETPYTLTAEDFLGSGQDAMGKADYQGCGEFNPVLVFSEQESKDFSNPQKKPLRDEANEPNRRVLIFLFRPGLRIDPAIWPCPRASEGSAGCKKRFFSDGEQRRSPQSERREVRNKDDTFACRFYDRLSRKSPCELSLVTFRVRLYDPVGIAISGAPFEATIGDGAPISGTTSEVDGEEGVAVIANVEVPNLCVIKWGYPLQDETDSPDDQLAFTLQIFLIHDDSNEDEEARQKLHNLGYDKDKPSTENIKSFRRDFGHLASPPLQVLNGKLSDDGGQTMKLLRDVYRQCALDLLNTPP